MLATCDFTVSSPMPSTSAMARLPGLIAQRLDLARLGQRHRRQPLEKGVHLGDGLDGAALAVVDGDG